MTLHDKFKKQSLDDRQSMLTYQELQDLCSKLDKAINQRNEVEGKAHRLFTEPLSNGQRFAHGPEQCDPLGFVRVLRAALEASVSGKQLANPFILSPTKEEKL